MIHTIYGPKGSGKTKQIFDAANAAAEKNDGNVVLVTDSDSTLLGLSQSIRTVYIAEYGIKGAGQLIGFLKGMLASDFDMKHVFVDGLIRITGVAVEGLQDLFDEIEAVSKDVDFTFAVTTGDNVPAFVKKHAIK